jgi:hypothetical protein
MTVATEVGRLDGVGGSGFVSQEALFGDIGESRSRGPVEEVVVWEVVSSSLMSNGDKDGRAACELLYRGLYTASGSLMGPSPPRIVCVDSASSFESNEANVSLRLGLWVGRSVRVLSFANGSSDVLVLLQCKRRSSL